jgi:spore germination protein GerM
MEKKRSSIGCLFWVALILLVVVVFLFNRERIKNVLESTGFTSLIAKEKDEDEENVEITLEGEEGLDSEDTVSPSEDMLPNELIYTSTDVLDEVEDLTESEQIGTEDSEEVSEEVSSEVDKLRNAKLYFIEVDADGVINLQAITRPVQFHDSPLTETLRELLHGLLPSELNMELLTLIPEKTELRTVQVNNSVAFIDFNEAFRFNTLGLEGYKAQLKQIVYTATEFSTVDGVQILIDGSRYDYLGPEGVFIGQPLTRSSFN